MRRFAAAAVLTSVFLIPAGAAEKIGWEDLQRRFGGRSDCPAGHRCEGLVERRSVDVITRDGRKHHTRRLLIDTDHMRLYGRHDKMEALPRQEVTRIEIRQTGRYFHGITDSGAIPLGAAGFVCTGFGESPCNPLAFAVTLTAFSPIWVYTAVTAPVFLAADGVAFFIPPKVFEIVP